MKIANKISGSFFIIALILTSIAGTVFYLTAKDNLTKAIYNNLVTACCFRSDHIKTYLKMLEISVGQLSKSVVLEDFLLINGKENPQQGEAFEQAMRMLKRTDKANPSIDEFLLTDRTGKVVASSNESSIGSDKSMDSFFLGGQKETYIKDVYYSEDYKEPLIAASVPIFSSQTGELLGVLAGRVRLTDLNNITASEIGMGKTGEIYIVNKDGLMITPSRFKEDAVLKQKVDTENVRQARLHKDIEHLLSQDKLVDLFPDYRGVQVLGAHEYIPQMQWAVLAEIDIKEAFAPLAKLRLIFFLILLIVPIAAWLLGIFIAKLITGPLHKLHKGTEIIGSGNLDYKVGTDAKDEVGQLSRAFDTMTENLKKTTTSIDIINKEIAEHKKAEKALRDSEGRFRAIFDNANDGILLADKETKKFYTGNNTACQMLGYSLEEIKNLGVTDIHPKEDLPHVIEQFERQVRRESAVAKDLPVKRKDGTVFYADVNSSLVTLAGRTYLLGIFRDITERKKAEEALRESEERYRIQFEQNIDALLLADTQTGIILECNRAAMELMGREKSEIVGQHQRILHPSEERGGNFSASFKQHVTGETLVETKIIKKSGEIRDVAIKASMFDLKGRKVILAIFRDITEHKQAEEELRLAYKKLQQTQQDLIQSSKMAAMGQLAAGISHELNQPLTGIKGFAQAVLMDLEKESPFRKDLTKIVAQADRMDTIIKNVRFFARKSDFNMVELDINQIIRDSLMLLSQQLKVHNIRLIQEFGADIPKIQGDPNQLQQAFLNIISNSRDAILGFNRPEGGEIRIRTSLSQDKNHVEAIFQDTGCGIPEENIELIFSPFFTTKSPDKGMGLGSSIVYRIIENHQGQIDFKTKVGEGTTFRIVLPVKQT